jgi:hypothetical protein
MGQPTGTNSGNYSPTPIDLSTAKKLLNQYYYDKWIVTDLCLYCGLVDHFKDQYPILASNKAQKVYLAAVDISTPKLDSIPSPALDLGKE